MHQSYMTVDCSSLKRAWNLSCAIENSKFTSPFLTFWEKIFILCFTFPKMKVLKSSILFSSFRMDLDCDRTRKRPWYVVYLTLLPLLLETVKTGVSDNTQHYFRAPCVKDDFMQSFKQNLPGLPETEQDCFRNSRVTVLQVQTAPRPLQTPQD